MASNPQILLLLPFLLLTSGGAHNITQILESNSSYSTSKPRLLMRSTVAKQSPFLLLTTPKCQQSPHILSRFLSISWPSMSSSTIMTQINLATFPIKAPSFQTSGIANNKLGFLNVTNMPNDVVAFGSATSEAPLSSTLTKVVTTKPYNISVLQISDLIVPPGIEGAKQASPPATSEAKPTNSTAHAPTTIEKTPVDAPTEAPNTVDSPMDDPETSENTPTDAPKADASDEPKTHSSASHTVVNAILGLVVGVIYLGAF